MPRSNAHGDADADYASLSEFRYQLRLFLRFSEDAAREAGLEPQQHQLLLAAKGATPGQEVTVGYLTERLQLRHHSTVELLDRLEVRGLVRRQRSIEDRRRVLVTLTAKGERVLAQLSRHHVEAVRSARGLVRSLDALLKRAQPAEDASTAKADRAAMPPSATPPRKK
ncbi:MAG TPA: MarR family winged helix-turn-helix transcriptional regulator [Dehalococcoidia bacterium]|jgi:DNA-binding MarR family transcriptional regulator|nr:MarR family winged helix-turn-helix transcriptional regulator [Dehalococcoidia bacterium]